MAEKMKEQEERRLVENEVIFKQVNKDIEGFLNDMDVQKAVRVPFYCECSNLNCTERIELTAAEYEKIHQNPKRFIVVNGHENLEIEKVYERRNSFAIIEKLRELPTPEQVEHRLKELER